MADGWKKYNKLLAESSPEPPCYSSIPLLLLGYGFLKDNGSVYNTLSPLSDQDNIL